jgi:hypothetical protein
MNPGVDVSIISVISIVDRDVVLWRFPLLPDRPRRGGSFPILFSGAGFITGGLFLLRIGLSFPIPVIGPVPSGVWQMPSMHFSNFNY